jgi:hypothetical protein
MQHDIVGEYAEEMASGTVFPPLTVFHDGQSHWLADGFHRYGAAVRLGLAEIECDVRQGTLSDAQWASFGANRAHGMRRTNSDKVRSIKAALKHSPHLSDSEIARHVGVSTGMVGKYRQELQSSPSDGRIGKIPSATRMVTRNGTTYAMKTGRIGRFRDDHKPFKPGRSASESYVAWLTPNNPVAAARVLWSRCPREYLAAMVEELASLLRQQPDPQSPKE